MASLTVVVGFPGSGKSHHVEVLRQQTNARIFGDFCARFLDQEQRFAGSDFGAVVTALKKEESCIIDDVSLCNERLRLRFAQWLNETFPEIQVSWVYFEADSVKCLINICGDYLHKDRGNIDERLRALFGEAERYHVRCGQQVQPEGKILPVTVAYQLGPVSVAGT